MSLATQLKLAGLAAEDSFSDEPADSVTESCPLAKIPHWIEIVLKDNAGKVVPLEPFVVYPGHKRPVNGTLDENGFARVEFRGPGNCKVIFPNREKTWWRPDEPVKPPPVETLPPIEPVTLPKFVDDWIEITLADDQGNRIAEEPYKIILKDGPPIEGVLDQDGFARVEGLTPGTYKVVFPSREKTWWRPDQPIKPPALEKAPTVESVAFPKFADDWMEITLADDQGNPIPEEPYQVLIKDAAPIEGVLDENGFARVEGLTPGKYKVAFPNREAAWWKPDAAIPQPELAKVPDPVVLSMPDIASSEGRPEENTYDY